MEASSACCPVGVCRADCRAELPPEEEPPLDPPELPPPPDEEDDPPDDPPPEEPPPDDPPPPEEPPPLDEEEPPPEEPPPLDEEEPPPDDMSDEPPEDEPLCIPWLDPAPVVLFSPDTMPVAEPPIGDGSLLPTCSVQPLSNTARATRGTSLRMMPPP